MNLSSRSYFPFPSKSFSIYSSLLNETDELKVQHSQDRMKEEDQMYKESTYQVSRADEPTTVSKKMDFFFEEGGNPASMSWPVSHLPDHIVPLSVMSELGNLFICHLSEVGLLNTTEDSPFEPLTNHFFSNVYHSSMTFQVSYRHQVFKISLDIDFGFESSTTDDILETEEFANYLKNLVILRKRPSGLDTRFENLKIISVKCFLNDLELDI